jgi:alkylation response protein AidB-like acyl-CoA dehydrogenase
MTVDLVPAPTDEQAMLVDASVRFMESEHPLAAVRSFADGGGYDDDAYRRTAAELGWFGMLADDSHGGGSMSGNGLLDVALIAAERGARLQPGPFVGHNVVVHALATADAHGAVLDELVAGRAWASWAHGSATSCEVHASGGELRLRGTIPVVADGAECAWLLLSASTTDGVAQMLVRTDAPGVTMRPLEGIDVTRRWSAVDLVDVAVTSDDLVGTADRDTEARLARQGEIAAVLSAAESVGAMHADFDVALQYSKDRIAFGRPIGSFQAIKHLLADTSLWLEMAKALVTAAATSVGGEAPDGAELAHAAKAFVAERGMELAQNCFQVFGGIGYTWEHDQHFWFRRLAADAECFGPAPEHRRQLLDLVGVSR